jgi:hypothetical protein
MKSWRTVSYTGSVTRYKKAFLSTNLQEWCRVDSGHMLCCRRSNFQIGNHPARAHAREIVRAALVRSYSRLPTHLAHPLKYACAVFIHALGPSLQGSWQNRGEPCRLFPVDIPGLGSIVVTTRRLCTIDTRGPFNHVEIDLQNAPLAEDGSATGTSVNSAPLRRTERPVPKNRFFTSCCVMWKLRECDRLPNRPRQRFGSRANRTHGVGRSARSSAAITACWRSGEIWLSGMRPEGSARQATKQAPHRSQAIEQRIGENSCEAGSWGVCLAFQ